jgi:hypothetical protein
MAQKPAIFFSHSSKDKENIIALKNALDRIANGTLDIFLSSDGQSIRFGTNWVHSIEDGLNRAEIMFVFVTPNSLQSDWIYFEAGFAYHKGIDVIPVGFGIDIGLLKPPLNLMQGFNLNSIESMDNLVIVLNEKFKCKFENTFTKEEFELISSKKVLGVKNKWIQIVDGIQISNVKCNFIEAISKTEKYLRQEKVNYSCNGEKIITLGIEIARDDYDLTYSISPYNFEKSFDLLIKLLPIAKEVETTTLVFFFKDDCRIISETEKISSLILNDSDEFSLDEHRLGLFKFRRLEFQTISLYNPAQNSYFLALQVELPLDNSSCLELYDLVGHLLDSGVILK